MAKKKRTTIRRSGPGKATQERVTPAIRGMPNSAPPRDPDQDQIDALVRLRYGGQEQQLGQQSTNIGQWFPQYQARIAQAAQASQAYYAGLQQGNLQAQAQSAQGPNLGPGVSADVQAQSQLAGASRASQVGQFGQALGAAGGAENAFLQNQGVVGAAAQLGAQQGNLQARAQLAQDKGAYATQAKADIQEQKHKQELERAAFGMKVDTEKFDQNMALTKEKNKQTAAKEKRNQQLADRKRDTTAKNKEVNKYGYTNEQWQRFSPSHRQRIIKKGEKGKDPKELTPGQAREGRVNFRKAVNYVKKNGSTDTESLYDRLVNEGGADPVVARAAVQLVRKGHLGPKTARALERDYGIKPPRGRPSQVVAIRDRPSTAPGARGQQRPN